MGWKERWIPESVREMGGTDGDGAEDDAGAAEQPRSLVADRRSFMRAGTALAALGVAGGAHVGASLYAQYKRFYEPVLDDAKELLSGSTTTDWAYQDGRAVGRIHEMVTDAVTTRIPLIDTGRPRSFQEYCPDEYLVGSPEDSIMGLFHEDGHLTGFHDGESHNIPFSRQGHPSDAAYLPEGGFAGVRRNGAVDWLGPDFDTVAAGRDDGIYRHVFRDPETGADIERHTYVLFGTDQLVMDYRIDGELEGTFIYYLMGNANSTLQNSMVFETAPNTLTSRETDYGRTARFASLVDDTAMAVTLEDADRTRLGRAPITDADRRDAIDRTRVDPLRSAYENLFNPLGMVADVGGELGDLLADWMLADVVDREDMADMTPGHDLDELLQADDAAARGRYLAAVHETTMDGDVTVTISPGNGRTAPRGSADRARAAWADWRSGLATDGLPEQDRRLVEEMAATAVKTHIGGGRWLAAPHIQPNYNRIWPRDACYAAEFAAEAGMEAVSADTIRYLSGLLEPGEAGASFGQCYSPDGEYAGLVGVEMDQMPIFVETAYRVDAAIDHDLLAESAVQAAVADATAYMADAFGDNGLIAASHDYKEQPMDVTQSLWTNASAYNAFMRVSADDRVDGDYREEAAELRAAMEDVLKDGERWARSVSWDGDVSYKANGMAAERIARIDWLGDLDAVTREDGTKECGRRTWTPSQAERAKGLYTAGRDDAGDVFMDRLRCLKKHGAMPERIGDDGAYNDARHLTWAQANTGLAVYRKHAEE